MLSKIKTACIIGIDAQLVEVQCDVSQGVPSFDTIGLPEMSVREARVRVRSAIRHSGLPFPTTRVTVALTPSDVRKEGTGYDLAVALAVLVAGGVLPADTFDGYLVVGELSLDGAIRPVWGVSAVAELAKSLGLRIICAVENSVEAQEVVGPMVGASQTIADLVAVLQGKAKWFQVLPTPAGLTRGRTPMDWSDVRGHALAKRALEIAAAGGHPVLLTGTPGTGKTMLARRLPSILPPLDHDEAIEVTKIQSVAGLLPRGAGLATERPFRAPHYTVAPASLIGGGSNPKPGEVSLAHRGVLFLDELVEFQRQTIEGLCQPLQEGQVVVTRTHVTAKFPAKPLLVAAMNPCPCGYLGGKDKTCTCSLVQVERYHSRLSPHIRFDLQVTLRQVTPAMLRHAPEGETSAVVQARVIKARSKQKARWASYGTEEGLNSEVSIGLLRRSSPLSANVGDLLTTAMERLNLTPKTHDQVWRVARTIADLRGADDIETEDMAEALQYVGGL